MKILVIDGQGGRMGKALVEKLIEMCTDIEIIAVGTNSTATAAMLKAGAQKGATGENPVVVNAPWAEVIVGPIGILTPNALLGEITPKMAFAIGNASAKKVLLPVSRCGIEVVSTQELPLAEYVNMAALSIANCKL